MIVDCVVNLFDETLEKLKEHNLTPREVRWVGSQDGQFAITWEEFTVIAKSINYDCSYGVDEINTGLVVVGDGWWLERGEYDGSEWWEYNTLPERVDNPKTFDGIKDSGFQVVSGFYKPISPENKG